MLIVLDSSYKVWETGFLITQHIKDKDVAHCKLAKLVQFDAVKSNYVLFHTLLRALNLDCVNGDGDTGNVCVLS